MNTKVINCSVCVANNDSKFFFGSDNKKRLTYVSLELVWDNVSKKLYLDIYPLNVVDFGDRRIAADVAFPNPYEFKIEIAKGARNAKKESELFLKYLEENAEALMNAYNELNKQGIVDVICNYKHKMRGLKQTTRTYYVMELDSYGQPNNYHCKNLSPDMIGVKWVVEDLQTVLYLTQN